MSADSHAFVWTPSRANSPNGSIHDLGTVSGADESFGRGINASGQITGSLGYGDNSHVMLYDGAMHDLGTLGGSSGSGYGINDNGQVAGSSLLSGDNTGHAFVWTSTTANGNTGAMHDLGTLGGTQSNASAINSNGQVTGGATTLGDTVSHAFVWTPDVANGTTGSMHDLGSLGEDSQGTAINNSGQVAGYYFPSTGGFRAFFYDGTMHDLGTLGGPISLRPMESTIVALLSAIPRSLTPLTITPFCGPATPAW